jgi:hypothetical protein
MKRPTLDDVFPDEKVELTNDQCRMLLEALNKRYEGNWGKCLADKKIITVDPETGYWSVLKYEGLKTAGKKAFFKYNYTSDIPYDLWKQLVEQVSNYERRVAYVDKQKTKELEEMSRQVGHLPGNLNDL